MRFMLMFKGEPPRPGDVACRQNLPEMKKLMTELKAKGVVVSTEGLEGPEKGARVKLAGGKYTVIDGPFAEAKELIAGYTLISARSRDEALEWTRRFPNPVGEGREAVIEVRQLYELDDFGARPSVERFRDMNLPGQTP